MVSDAIRQLIQNIYLKKRKTKVKVKTEFTLNNLKHAGHSAAHMHTNTHL